MKALIVIGIALLIAAGLVYAGVAELTAYKPEKMKCKDKPKEKVDEKLKESKKECVYSATPQEPVSSWELINGFE